jgi:hypothetical protein
MRTPNFLFEHHESVWNTGIDHVEEKLFLNAEDYVTIIVAINMLLFTIRAFSVQNHTRHLDGQKCRGGNKQYYN